MNFFIKRSQVTLDCFTSENRIFEFSKPNQSINFLPDWWRGVPSFVKEEKDICKKPTIKKCPGLIDQFSNGIMLPLWSDLNIKVGPIGTDNYEWQFSDCSSHIEFHNFAQLNNVLNTKFVQHFKLINPWLFSCKDDLNWFWVDPAWNHIQNNSYKILPGVISFKYQKQANINLFVYKEAKDIFLELPFGEPLVQLIPLTEKKLKINHHLVSKEEFEKIDISRNRICFIGSYSKIKTIMKGK